LLLLPGAPVSAEQLLTAQLIVIE
jgi:hypothetical protein